MNGVDDDASDDTTIDYNNSDEVNIDNKDNDRCYLSFCLLSLRSARQRKKWARKCFLPPFSLKSANLPRKRQQKFLRFRWPKHRPSSHKALFCFSADCYVPTKDEQEGDDGKKRGRN